MTSATLVAGPALGGRRIGRGWLVLAVLAAWLVLWFFLRGTTELEDGQPDTVQSWLYSFIDWVDAGRMTNPLFIYVFTPITNVISATLVAIGWVIYVIGWTGMTATMSAISLVIAGWRMAVLTAIGFLGFAVLGLWTESMETLAQVFLAVVISVLIGVPLGVWAGVSRRFERFLLPVLDTMQILPSFAYLPIITLFFLIGPPAGIIATVIYAAPPIIRLTCVGIREVQTASVEASRSLGATKGQTLRTVQLPMAKSAIVVGLNQTIMAALSMVTIAAVIAAPGLGEVVLNGLTLLNVGIAFNAGLAIVIMAIVLDRVITSASRRPTSQRAGKGTWIVAAGVALVGMVIPGLFPRIAFWDKSWVYSTEGVVNAFSDWIQATLYPFTSAFTNWFTTLFINPFQNFIVSTPFYVTIAALTVITLIVGNYKAAITAGLCLAGITIVALWPSSMETLTQVIFSTIAVMVIGIVVGVWIGRSRWADRIIRPVLDALQVMPPFVYLVPCLALFGPTRFTAIFAAFVYAVPVVIKIVGEGISSVGGSALEATRAAGANRWQEIFKVQLPLARPMVMVALNQGIVFVMAMVVIGGLVGGGGLGYQVVKGFAQQRFAGVGLAAGIAIVLLGVAIDRLTQSAGASRRNRTVWDG